MSNNEQLAEQVAGVQTATAEALAHHKLKLATYRSMNEESCTTTHFEAHSGIKTVTGFAFGASRRIPVEPTITSGIFEVIADIHIPGRACRETRLVRLVTEGVTVSSAEDGDPWLGRRRITIAKAISGLTVKRGVALGSVFYQKVSDTTTNLYEGVPVSDTLTDYFPASASLHIGELLPLTPDIDLARLYNIRDTLQDELTSFRNTAVQGSIASQYVIK